ncbi:hypothetical protein BpHYR1_001277 [Brachionus plicatilis]|uniref:Uncharacterized protein n=1 Tax=Brachionus plicatilis TaxID=10195 RepID=A0A3M7P7I5_BRAPC|nr:hypothetical protein BpHYR1_001277 [Brachionus plicatilis]
MLQFLWSVHSHRASLDINIEHFEPAGRMADKLFQILLEIAHSLSHIDPLKNLLVIVFYLDINSFADVHVDVRQSVQLAMLGLQLVVAAGLDTRVHEKADVLSLAVLLVII